MKRRRAGSDRADCNLLLDLPVEVALRVMAFIPGEWAHAVATEGAAASLGTWIETMHPSVALEAVAAKSDRWIARVEAVIS